MAKQKVMVEIELSDDFFHWAAESAIEYSEVFYGDAYKRQGITYDQILNRLKDDLEFRSAICAEVRDRIAGLDDYDDFLSEEATADVLTSETDPDHWFPQLVSAFMDHHEELELEQQILQEPVRIQEQIEQAKHILQQYGYQVQDPV
jgi:hypothetical protein